MGLRRLWDRHARDWIAWARPPGHDHFFYEYNLPAFLPLLPPPPMRCLDLGCGEGRVGRALTERGYEVLSVDGSPLLAAATAAVDGGSASVTADAVALPFPDETFDLVVAFMSLQDIDDLDGAVAEVARVLRPRATLCAAIMHPFFSAGWVPLDDRTATHTGAEPYYVSRSYRETVELDSLRMTLHSVHRPLEAHIAALGEAGLVLDALREPEPSGSYVAAHPETAALSRIPMYLHYRARKP